MLTAEEVAADRQQLANRVLPIVLAICIGLWLAPIGFHRLLNPDEGRYSEISREMLASHDWVTPHLNGLVYLEKPPLQYWTTALIFSVFGESEWSARLWAAATGLLSVILTGWLAARIFNRRTGMLAAAVHGGMLLQATLAHLSTLDTGLSFFMQLSLAGMILLAGEPEQRNRYLAPALIAVGVTLAFLSKGLIGIVFPAVTFGIYFAVNRDRRLLARAKPAWIFILLAIVGGSWVIAITLQHPEFLKYFFVREHFERFLSRIDNRYQPFWFFIPILLVGFMPWTPFLVGIIRNSIEKCRARDPVTLILVVWIVFIFLFFSISQSKLIPYIQPLVPALALLAGGTIAASDEVKVARNLAIAGGLLIAVGIAATLIHMTTSRIEIALGNAATGMLLAPWFGGILVIVAAFVYRRSNLLGMWVAALGSIVIATVALNAAPHLPGQSEAEEVSEKIAEHASDETSVYCVGDYVQTVPYYSKRPCVLVDYQGELDFGLSLEPHRWIPNLGEFFERWRSEDDALAVVSPYVYRYMESIGEPMRVLASGARLMLIEKN